jgi:hypothetical protein
MRVLRFTQAQPSGPASSAAATIAASASAAADSSASHKAAVAAAAAAGPLQGLGSRLSALNPVPAVLGLLTQPMVRESAQEQLRRELQGEGGAVEMMNDALQCMHCIKLWLDATPLSFWYGGFEVTDCVCMCSYVIVMCLTPCKPCNPKPLCS